MLPLRHVAVALVVLAASLARVQAVEVDSRVPRDAQLIACLQVRQFAEAPAVKKHFRDIVKDVLARRTFLGALTKLLAVDPLQDIDRITLAGPATLEAERSLLIVRGRFDRAKIEATLADRLKQEPETLQLVEKGSGRGYRFRDASGASPFYFAFVDKETLLAAAAPEPLFDALARKDEKSPASLGKELQALLDRIDTKATAWAAAVATPELKKLLAAPPEYRRFVDSVQTLRGGLTVGDGIQADIRMQTNDARAAVEIRKFMEGIKAILILAAVNQDKAHGAVWGDLLALLKVASDGDAVTIKGEASAEQIAKSIEANRQMRKE